MGKKVVKYEAVTWDTIFPRTFRKQSAKGESLCTFYLKRILPDGLRILTESDRNKYGEYDLAVAYNNTENNGTAKGYTQGELSKFWNGNPPHIRFSRFGDNLINHAQNGNFSFETSPIIAQLKDNLCDLRDEWSDSTRETFDALVDTTRKNLIKAIGNKSFYFMAAGVIPEMAERCLPAKPSESDTSESALTADLDGYDSTLASLILVASTWTLWETASYKDHFDKLRILARIIFPAAMMQAEIVPQEDWTAEREQSEQSLAEAKMKIALLNYEKGNFAECVKDCLFTIGLAYATDEMKGKAYYYAVKCREDHQAEWDGEYDADKWMRKACSYGNELARKEWTVSHLDSLNYTPTPWIGNNREFVLNAENEHTKAFERSLQEDDAKCTICNLAGKSCSEYVKSGPTAQKQTFLLWDDDPGKNYRDLIAILNMLRGAYTLKKDTLLDGKEIYIRVPSEEYAGFIDTALKQMKGAVVPVHILDEPKLAAQNLLARHPLFYPIRSLPKNTLTSKRSVINLVIICDNENELAMWLAREAYWLGCFWYKGVHVQITIVSRQGTEIENKLRFQCSGIFGDYSDENISSVSVNVVKLTSTTISTPEMYECLEKLNTENNYFPYYVVACDNDISGVNLGIMLREWTIRKLVWQGKKLGKNELPVIAVYCEDDDIAHLAKKMVVQTADQGDTWYNNYSILPFGMLSEMFGGYELTSDYFENAALATHLQYSNVPPEAKRKELNAALVGFFNRYYNYDSSRAVALSLPYRLFQTQHSFSAAGQNEHIFPAGWDIYERESYTDISASGSIKEMAAAFKQSIQNNEETKMSLAKYEHERWNRWMISRGWVPSTPRQTISYMQAGNPKQQLFIARMHGCMIPYDQLPGLQKALAERAGKQFERFADDKEKYDYFTKFDITSIEKTPAIMELSWGRSREAEIT